MEEQSFLAWWFYGDDEDSFFRAFFRTVSIFALGVAAAPIVVPIVKDIGQGIFSGGSSQKQVSSGQQVQWLSNNPMNQQLGFTS
jgi:hypothetical protein